MSSALIRGNGSPRSAKLLFGRDHCEAEKKCTQKSWAAGRSYGETIPVRLSSPLKDEVDVWANKQSDARSRSEALGSPPGEAAAAKSLTTPLS